MGGIERKVVEVTTRYDDGGLVGEGLWWSAVANDEFGEQLEYSNRPVTGLGRRQRVQSGNEYDGETVCSGRECFHLVLVIDSK